MRVIIFGSGTGTNFQAILNEVYNGKLNIKIEALVCNKSNAPIIDKAKNKNIPVIIEPYSSKRITREEYYSILKEKIVPYSPDLIILAGWMLIITPEFLRCFPNMINLHPALPGKFAGKDGIGDAYRAFQKRKIQYK